MRKIEPCTGNLSDERRKFVHEWKGHPTLENSWQCVLLPTDISQNSRQVALIQVNQEVSSNISHQTKQRYKLT